MTESETENLYTYTSSLNKEQWAWEFLRRNPDYKVDYKWFISQWRALEKDYGKVPDNDYQAWKQDPRSYKIIDISSEQDGNCAISEDKLLIECWMGYKWGFFKFPQDPEKNAKQLQTSWRPLSPDSNELSLDELADRPILLSEKDKLELLKTTVFDLTKPLKEQVERIKQQVIVAQRRLRKQGRLKPYTIAGKRELWCLCLRLLDAKKENISDKEIQICFHKVDHKYDLELIQNEAEHYLLNYLDILTFMEK